MTLHMELHTAALSCVSDACTTLSACAGPMESFGYEGGPYAILLDHEMLMQTLLSHPLHGQTASEVSDNKYSM